MMIRDPYYLGALRNTAGTCLVDGWLDKLMQTAYDDLVILIPSSLFPYSHIAYSQLRTL